MVTKVKGLRSYKITVDSAKNHYKRISLAVISTFGYSAKSDVSKRGVGFPSSVTMPRGPIRLVGPDGSTKFHLKCFFEFHECRNGIPRHCTREFYTTKGIDRIGIRKQSHRMNRPCHSASRQHASVFLAVRMGRYNLVSLLPPWLLEPLFKMKMKDLAEGSRGIIEVLVNGMPGTIVPDYIRGYHHAVGCAGRTGNGFLRVSFADTLEVMGGHAEPVSDYFVITADPGMREEVTEGLSNIAVFLLGVMVAIGEACFFVEFFGVHEMSVSGEMHVRGEVNVFLPIGEREDIFISIFASSYRGSLDRVFVFIADAVGVRNGSSSRYSQDGSSPATLVVKPLQGFFGRFRERNGRGVWMNGNMAGIVRGPRHFAVAFDSFSGVFSGAIRPGSVTDRACGSMAC